MIRIVLFSLLFLVLSAVVNSYVKKTYASISKVKGSAESSAEGISIKAYSRSGIEWTITGKYLYSKGSHLELKDAVFKTDKEEIRARRSTIDRDTLRGLVEGGMELTGEGIHAETQRANLDLKEGKVYGSGEIHLKEWKKETWGKGFTVYIRPMKVIIENAKVRLE
ncbi:MAG: hypothetical protein ACK4SM_02160 [Aquificaceae bacterium]